MCATPHRDATTSNASRIPLVHSLRVALDTDGRVGSGVCGASATGPNWAAGCCPIGLMARGAPTCSEFQKARLLRGSLALSVGLPAEPR